MSKAEDILDRAKGLAAKRDVWRGLWQELADVLYPTRGGFTAALTPGQETSAPLYDSTPMQARRGLATAIDGMLKPATSRWFWMKSEDTDRNEEDGAKTWFDVVVDRMWGAIYSPDSRFIQQSGAVDNDLATFGLGYLWIDENRARNGLNFRSLHIGDVAIDENSDGVVDTASVTRRFTARQAEQKFTREKLGKNVLEALTSTDPKSRDKVFEFVQLVQPNYEADPRRRDNLNLPFASSIVCVEDAYIVEESGYHEFPMPCPRWEVAAGSIYPRSPGMLALPDARTLQAMGKTLLIGGQKAVDPPVWAVDDGVLSVVRTWPGGMTTVSAEAVRETGGRPLGVLEMGKNIPLGREMQDDYRRMVEAAFFKNVFNLPVDAGKMTATEILERKEEFLRTIGPTLGQLETDYLGVTINRVFGIMMRGGAFPPPPEELMGSNARFEFMSPVQQAKRQVEAAGLARAFEFIGPVLQLQPETADNINGDEIVRDLPDAFGLRQKWLRPKDQVEQMRAQRMQDQQEAAALAQANAVAQAAKTGTEANKNLVEAEAA